MTFAEVRALYPHTRDVVYFNSASYGPYCTPMKEAGVAYFDLRLRADRDDSHDAFDLRRQLRAAYAGLIGAEARQVGLGLNTTFGLNLAAFGLPFTAGDEILISDVEFPAIAYTFRAAAERRNLSLRFVESTNRQFDSSKLRKALTPRSRALIVSWVQFFDGFRVDLDELAGICREHGLYFIVDGIQGMGAVPIDVKKSEIDLFTSGCQKWMLSPQGCGFFYISDRIRGELQHPFMSWLGVDWKMDFTDLFKYDLPWFDSAEQYEMGYYVVENLIGMVEAVKLFQGLGIANIERHNLALIDRLVAYLKTEPFYTITSSLDPRHRSSIFTFACVDLKELHRYLLDARIILVRREGSIRVSVHLYNNEQDIDRLIERLRSFAAGAR